MNRTIHVKAKLYSIQDSSSCALLGAGVAGGVATINSAAGYAAGYSAGYGAGYGAGGVIVIA